ncbi:hypothetical protein P8452_32544 [Trifolium repens]|nr:hypothetical protein P8452_32544 [Trifolium repens]
MPRSATARNIDADPSWWDAKIRENVKYAKFRYQKMKSVFPHPPEGKYYLVDAGYPNMKGYLSPYKDIHRL